MWTKQPAEVLDYEFDFSAWLTSVGESAIESHVAMVDIVNPPNGLEIQSSEVMNDNLVKVWCIKGEDTVKYKVTVRITTPAGRVKEAESYLTVKEK